MTTACAIAVAGGFEQEREDSVIFNGVSVMLADLQSSPVDISVSMSGSSSTSADLQPSSVDISVIVAGASSASEYMSFVFDASAAPSAGLVFLPSEFTLTCSSTSRVSQQSASTLQTGYGANAARARSVDGSNWGLSVEKSATNTVLYSTDLSLGVTNTKYAFSDGNISIPTTGLADPAGGTTGEKLNNAASGLPYIISTATLSGSTNQSAWLQINTGSPSMFFAGGAHNGTVFNPAVAWGQFDYHDATANAGWALRFNGGPYSANVTFVQLESGSYPTSRITTTTGTVTRNADILDCTATALASPLSYADWTIHYRPNYAASETSADHDLLFWDTNTRLYFRQSDQKFVLHTPGSADVVSAAQTFTRETDMTIRIVHSSTVKSMTVNGVTTTGSVGTTLAASSNLYILGNASGAQECGDLVKLQLDYAA